MKTADLQAIAEDTDTQIEVAAIPGAFASPGRPLAYVSCGADKAPDCDDRIASAFVIGNDRTFEDDPRFGLIVLSEIASKALSPGINDPGSAISVIGSMVRLFVLWNKPIEDESAESKYARVGVPTLSLEDMFNDAFSAIARDGAGSIKVVLRLQKGLESVAFDGDIEVERAARRHARIALARVEKALDLPDDLEAARRATQFAMMS